jgi:hypothetical protein
MLNRFAFPITFFTIGFFIATGRLLAQDAASELLRTNSDKITVILNKDTFPDAWTVDPSLEVDRFSFECKKDENYVSFLSDIDTVNFLIGLNDTVRFVILLTGKDSARTEIIGLPNNVFFSDEYIRQHKGKFDVDIPEVHELVNILVAISRVGRLDSNMVDMETAYYSEVLEYFLPFAEHPLLDTINAHIKEVKDYDSYWYYYALKMNACGYDFDEAGDIKNKGAIKSMGFENVEDPIVKNKELLVDFSNRSNFRSFYLNHQSYYDSLIVFYRQLNPIDKMQRWLEDKFGFGYGAYTVLFSPLVGGAHATQRFEDNGFEQTFMFVCRADKSSSLSDHMNEMIHSRVVFTEIDHNFVNPVSDKKLNLINDAFADRKKWVKVDLFGTDAYDNQYAVFNEYMTWALYSLYCMDNFPPKEVKQLTTKMESQMTDGRGFIKFDDFNRTLMKSYRRDPKINMDDLFNLMLAWSAKQ